MAYDPKARRDSKSALTIGLIAILAMGALAAAYFATRPSQPTDSPVVVTQGRKETVVVNNIVTVPIEVPAATPLNGAAAPAVVMAPGTNTITRIERNSTTVHDRIIAPSPTVAVNESRNGTGGNSDNLRSGNQTNVTINNGKYSEKHSSSAGLNTAPADVATPSKEADSGVSTSNSVVANQTSGY